jgi:hypothetical protein
LIFGPTLNGFPSNEESLAQAAGFTVTVADASTWSSMTTAQFSTYSAIVFGDPSCGTDPSILAPAIANESTWAPAVTGHIVGIGTDPMFHQSQAGVQADQLTTNAIEFAASGSGTGLYANLSCYFANTTSANPVSVLTPFGSFTVQGDATGCDSDINIVDTASPVVSGITNAGLGGWDCSVHEVFDSYPSSFSPVVVDTDFSPSRAYVITNAGSSLTVQGRVVEGYANQQTLSSTQWVASFTSTVSDQPTDFVATVDWGDDSAPTVATISTSDPSSCTYNTSVSPGQCFVVSARHTYREIGDWITTTTIQLGPTTASDRGIAEIVSSTGAPAQPNAAVGPITFNSGTSSQVYGCTAEALANVNVVMSIGHCTNNTISGQPNFNFEFAPQHKGQCSPSGGTVITIAACESKMLNRNKPLGTDPVGYWSAGGNDVYKDPLGAEGDGPSFIVMNGGSTPQGYELIGAVGGGLPVHFISPRGLSWSEGGTPVYAGVWSWSSCGPSTDISDPVGNPGLLVTQGCTFSGLSPTQDPSGDSGGPWFNSNYLRNAVGAVNKTWETNGTGNEEGGAVLDNGAMRAYIDAVLASGSAIDLG